MASVESVTEPRNGDLGRTVIRASDVKDGTTRGRGIGSQRFFRARLGSFLSRGGRQRLRSGHRSVGICKQADERAYGTPRVGVSSACKYRAIPPAGVRVARSNRGRSAGSVDALAERVSQLVQAVGQDAFRRDPLERDL